MKVGLSDEAVHRLASLKLGGDLSAEEDEPAEDPAKRSAEAAEDARLLHDKLAYEISYWMSRGLYKDALPLLRELIVNNPQGLWDRAVEVAELF
jgi:hypothetical protein